MGLLIGAAYYPEGKCFGFPERFNVEGSGEGIASYGDEHYKNWPEPWTEADIAHDWYLKSLTPAEELAGFLSTRGDCLTDNGRVAEACQAYDWARQLAPNDERYVQLLAVTHRKYELEYHYELDCLVELNSRSEQNMQSDSLTGSVSSTHPSGCQCANCSRNLEQATTYGQRTEHGPSCQCAHCKASHVDTNRLSGVAGHPPMCECFACRQNQRKRVPQPHWM